MHQASERNHQQSYQLIRTLLGPLLQHCIPLQVNGLANVPLTGPVLLVANHRSLLDPFLIGAVIPRHIHFVAESWFGAIPGLRRLSSKIGVIILPRSQRSQYLIELGKQQLACQAMLGIFPEGAWPTLVPSPPGTVLPFQAGAAKLIVESGIVGLTVVPAGITGQGEHVIASLPGWVFRYLEPWNPLYRRDRLEMRSYRSATLRFGQPHYFVVPTELAGERYQQVIAAISERLRTAIMALLY